MENRTSPVPPAAAPAAVVTREKKEDVPGSPPTPCPTPHLRRTLPPLGRAGRDSSHFSRRRCGTAATAAAAALTASLRLNSRRCCQEHVGVRCAAAEAAQRRGGGLRAKNELPGRGL
ncbi:uncharacterized protein LOC144457789 [Phascolarctos cinereus]